MSDYEIYRPGIRNGLTLVCLLKTPAIWCNEMGNNGCFGLLVGLSRELNGMWAEMLACVVRTALTAHFIIA